MAAPANTLRQPSITPPHFLADLYSFQWSELSFRLPAISAAAVALCLFAGILAGHPGGGLIAGGGAFTVGFGANQRIADSRLMPMIFAVFACSTATLAGTVAGHRSVWLVIAAAASATIYGVLTTRHAGLAWVGQQACVALVVSSAFPTGPGPALMRAGLIAAGGIVQTVVTSVGLRLLPDLRKDLLSIPKSIFTTVEEQQNEFLRRIRTLPHCLPALSRSAAFAYSLRLVITMTIATELYRQLGMQSGYWIPMTALLVQKPAFFETLTRGTLRVLGTLAGAWLVSLFLAHVALSPPAIALLTTAFALMAFATNSVNYGLFAAFLTGYIVSLLSLNQMPGPLIAHRRAVCTALGAAIALAIHVDALLRHRARNKAAE